MKFVMGERSEGVTTDFDGRLRMCETVDDGSEIPRGVFVTIDPPLPGEPPIEAAIVVPRHREEFRLEAGETISVYVLPAGDTSSIAYWADIALCSEDLPMSQEQRFDEACAGLRDGLLHADDRGFWSVAAELGLATWVENMVSMHEGGRLPAEWSVRLERLPGWTWSIESKIDLVRSFVEREGHTDIPIDHLENGRPLGMWVHQVRRVRSAVSDEIAESLESIPGWHW
ncbi:MAG: hypothetical protein BMS9Abin20_0195 [Acidimicrobiia bacterium]|nr:MAG: hypothetical protein BMS9Abin20_0195 [Acidimicrobiia bacterium]